MPPLAAGTHSLVAKQVGADGTEQAASAPVELTVADGQIVVATPAAVAGATAVPGAGAPAIKLPAAGLKASEPLTLEGTGTPGIDGARCTMATRWWRETVVAPDGTWTADGAAAGCRDAQPGGQAGRCGWQGAGRVSAGGVDGGGRADRGGDAGGVAAATAVPGAGAPAIKLPAAGLQASEPLTLEGTGTPGIDGARSYDGDAGGGRRPWWGRTARGQVTVPPLAAGTHSLVAKQVGADGKAQGASAPVELTVADGQIVVATPAVVAGTTVSPTAAAVAGAATAVATAAAGLPSTAATPAVSAPMVATPVGADRRCGRDHDARGYGRAGCNGQGLRWR